jgi:hypothetical protein
LEEIHAQIVGESAIKCLCEAGHIETAKSRKKRLTRPRILDAATDVVRKTEPRRVSTSIAVWRDFSAFIAAEVERLRRERR